MILGKACHERAYPSTNTTLQPEASYEDQATTKSEVMQQERCKKRSRIMTNEGRSFHAAGQRVLSVRSVFPCRVLASRRLAAFVAMHTGAHFLQSWPSRNVSYNLALCRNTRHPERTLTHRGWILRQFQPGFCLTWFAVADRRPYAHWLNPGWPHPTINQGGTLEYH